MMNLVDEYISKQEIAVQPRLNQIPYDGSIVNMGVKNSDGSVCYIIGVVKSIRNALAKEDGDTIHVVIRERM